LEDDAKVYKLIGPVLVKQDLVEARGNVEKRLDFIKAEADRLEKKAEEMQKKHGEAQKGIIELQQKMMALANPSAEGA
jgi:prefoldin beta subunit